MKNLVSIVKALMPSENFDSLGIGVLDFGKKTFDAFEAYKDQGSITFRGEPQLYFDLASLTKPLTNSLSYFLKPESFDEKLLLALNHRAGIPAWGKLSHDSWRELILSYEIKESETLYSDFSALRVLLELQKKGVAVKALCQTVWDKETLNWLDLPAWYPTPQYGFIDSRPNFGKVHDPNAYVIRDFTSHAGLFSTVDGLCRTLLNYEEKTHFIDKVKADLKSHSRRFSFGWDRVEDPKNTLAGIGCGPSTFGHLGFTGTSIWIDPDSGLGHVILSNATKYYWYDKVGLNDLRRAVGEKVWSQDL